MTIESCDVQCLACDMLYALAALADTREIRCY